MCARANKKIIISIIIYPKTFNFVEFLKKNHEKLIKMFVVPYFEMLIKINRDQLGIAHSTQAKEM